jgi:hypothetical protein
MPPRRRRAAMPPLTVRDLKQRAKAAGITLPDDAWEPMAAMMNLCLEPLRAFDTTAERTLEPAVTYRSSP